MDTFSNTQLDTAELPQVSNIQFVSLHEDYPKVVLISLIIKFLIFLIPINIGIYLIPKLDHHPVMIIAMIVLPLYILFIGHRGAKAKQYALREHDLLFVKGLFWQKTTAVSFNRIQHIDLSHGPLERKYGMASLAFFTAGGSSADLAIPGLPAEDAKNLRSFILQRTGLDTEQSQAEQL